MCQVTAGLGQHSSEGVPGPLHKLPCQSPVAVSSEAENDSHQQGSLELTRHSDTAITKRH